MLRLLTAVILRFEISSLSKFFRVRDTQFITKHKKERKKRVASASRNQHTHTHTESFLTCLTICNLVNNFRSIFLVRRWVKMNVRSVLMLTFMSVCVCARNLRWFRKWFFIGIEETLDLINNNNNNHCKCHKTAIHLKVNGWHEKSTRSMAIMQVKLHIKWIDFKMKNWWFINCMSYAAKKGRNPCEESERIYAATQLFVSLAISNSFDLHCYIHCICYDSGKMHCNKMYNHFWSGVSWICQSSLIKPNQTKPKKQKYGEWSRIAVSDDVKRRWRRWRHCRVCVCLWGDSVASSL